jgi:hypothetical protein
MHLALFLSQSTPPFVHNQTPSTHSPLPRLHDPQSPRFPCRSFAFLFSHPLLLSLAVPWPLPSSFLASSPSINPGSSRQSRLLLPRERFVAAVASLHVVPSCSLPRFGRSFSAPIAQSRAHNAPIAAPSFRNVVGCRPAKRRSHIESPAVLGARPVLPPSALVVTQELHPSEQCRFLPKSSRRPAAVARL